MKRLATTLLLTALTARHSVGCAQTRSNCSSASRPTCSPEPGRRSVVLASVI
jgi:hypothetical protein